MAQMMNDKREWQHATATNTAKEEVIWFRHVALSISLDSQKGHIMANRKVTIGVVAPARRIEPREMERVQRLALERYSPERLSLVVHRQCFDSHGHFAGRDETRAAAFLEFANHPDLDAIWFAKGGYGSFRFPDETFARLEKPACKKVYLGYSDTGALLARLYREGVGKPVHGPLVADIARQNGERAIERALDYFQNPEARHSLEPGAKDNTPRVAFNLTVLAHLCGTPWMPDLSGHHILLEDVGEYEYAIDRSLFTVLSEPGVRKAAAISMGRFSAVPENDVAFGETVEDCFRRWCHTLDIPFAGRADIGHDTDNKLVPFG